MEHARISTTSLVKRNRKGRSHPWRAGASAMAFAGPRREDSKAGLKAGVSRLGRSITQSLSEKSRSSPALGKVRAMASNVKAAAHSVEDKLHVVEDKLEGRHLTGEELLSSVLAIFDRDSDGYLMPVELKHILTAVHVWGVRKYTDEEIDELVKQYDSDGDGRFSVAELTKALSNLRLTEKALRHAAEGLPPPPPPPRPLPDVLGTEWLNMGPEPLAVRYQSFFVLAKLSSFHFPSSIQLSQQIARF